MARVSQSARCRRMGVEQIRALPRGCGRFALSAVPKNRWRPRSPRPCGALLPSLSLSGNAEIECGAAAAGAVSEWRGTFCIRSGRPRATRESSDLCALPGLMSRHFDHFADVARNDKTLAVEIDAAGGSRVRPLTRRHPSATQAEQPGLKPQSRRPSTRMKATLQMSPERLLQA